MLLLLITHTHFFLLFVLQFKQKQLLLIYIVAYKGGHMPHVIAKATGILERCHRVNKSLLLCFFIL